MSFFEQKVRFLLCAATLTIGMQAPLNLQAAKTAYSVDDKEEAFLVRRIAEFWKDQDYAIVKAQIISFLEKHPKSKINDHLRGILGDLYLQENAYEDALSLYSQIHTSPIIEKIILNKLQCFYELNLFDAMIQQGTPFLSKSVPEIDARKEEFRFLMGEAYFRAGLASESADKKVELFSKAEPLYEEILSSSFNDPSMFALAEIYSAKNESKKAADFFLQLADRHADKRDDLLFHAALSQSVHDRPGAIATFATIASKGGPKATDASLNHLILLFQEDRFDDVLKTYPKMLSSIPNDKLSVVTYMIGRSYFALENYKDSSEWLNKYILTASDPSLELRNALLMQLNSAQTLKNETLYHETMTLLQTVFPKDAELPQAFFVHAMMLKDKGDFKGSAEKLREILQNHPSFDSPESLLLEYSIVTHSNQDYEECHSTLATFLKKYPDSSFAPSAWKYFLSSGINLLKQKEAGENVVYSKQQFYDDLKKILAQKGALSPSELQECLFLQGKMGYELGKYNEALATFHGYLSSYSGDKTLPEAHLLTALCHNKLKGDGKLFCEHAEAALKGNPNLTGKSSIHLELYNTYLSTINKSQPTNSQVYDLAAEHLFQAMQAGDVPVKLENRLWLANYYFDKSVSLPEIFEGDGALPSPEMESAYTRSRSLLQAILIQGEEGKLTSLDKDHTFLEWEIVKLANLNGREKKYDKKIELLRALIEEQTAHPEWNWKLQKEALTELAKAYELTSQNENAYDTYKFIVDNFRKDPSFVAEYAALQTARLKFANLKPDQKKEDNPEVLKILSDLKELQIRKSAASEPLHLEAALEYAWIRAQVAKEEDRAFRYLFFLTRIKEDFNDNEDPMITTYHKALKENSAKAKLYAVYNQFLEAEIERCNAVFASKEGKSAQSSLCNDKARQILSTFVKEPDSTYYLRIRAEESLSALKKAKIV